MIKICKNSECNKSFKCYNRDRKYCSRKCSSHTHRLPRITKQCEANGCGLTFDVIDGSIRQRKFCSVDCQIEWQKTWQMGTNNGNYGRKNSLGTHSDERRELISEKVKETWKNPNRLVKHLEFQNRHRLPDGSFDYQDASFRDKISIANIKRLMIGDDCNAYSNCKSGYYESLKTNNREYYQSSWELTMMKYLDHDADVIHWTKKHNHIIKYNYNGYVKRYYPDFFVKYKSKCDTILEVKGYVDNKHVFKLKCTAALHECSFNNLDYVVDFMNNVNKYSDLVDWFNIEKRKYYG